MTASTGSQVLDASVLINLAATGHLRPILQWLQRPIVVANAYAEVRRNPRDAVDSEFLAPLLGDGTLVRVGLSPGELEVFVGLTGAPEPDDLDDGEAATLAYAAVRALTVVLDDTKPRRVCSSRFPGVTLLGTVDLLRRRDLEELLGKATLCEAIFDALRYGRMRVPEAHVAWVVDMIGADRAQSCTSLRRRLRTPP